jgi:hypothetical protein
MLRKQSGVSENGKANGSSSISGAVPAQRLRLAQREAHEVNADPSRPHTAGLAR